MPELFGPVFNLTGEKQIESFRSRFRRWLLGLYNAFIAFPEAQVVETVKRARVGEPGYDAPDFICHPHYAHSKRYRVIEKGEENGER